MDKSELRRRFLVIRNKVEDKPQKSETISNKLIEYIGVNKVTSILLYISAEGEVSLDKVMKYCFDKGIDVYLPFVKEIKVGKVENFDVLVEKGRFFEPRNEIKNFKIDLIVLPGIVFDENGNRIGYGTVGWYDKFLEENNSKTIGVCFDEQITEKIIPEDHDQKVDYVYTQNKVY